MIAAAIVLTVLLLLETLPSAAAGLSRAKVGLARLDQLTRLGLLDGRNLQLAGSAKPAFVQSVSALLAALCAKAALAALFP